MYNIPTGPSDCAPSPISDIRNSIDLKAGKPIPYMQNPPWIQRRHLGVDVNVRKYKRIISINQAYVEGHEEADRGSPHQTIPQEFIVNNSGKRKRDDYASHITPGGYIPQQDGSGHVVMEFSLQQNGASKGQQSLIRNSEETAISKFLCSKEAISSTILPQLAGVHDEYDDLFQFHGVANEDYNTPGNHVELRTPTPYVGTPIPNKNGADEDDVPPLNEDDDDEFGSSSV